VLNSYAIFVKNKVKRNMKNLKKSILITILFLSSCMFESIEDKDFNYSFGNFPPEIHNPIPTNIKSLFLSNRVSRSPELDTIFAWQTDLKNGLPWAMKVAIPTDVGLSQKKIPLSETCYEKGKIYYPYALGHHNFFARVMNEIGAPEFIEDMARNLENHAISPGAVRHIKDVTEEYDREIKVANNCNEILGDQWNMNIINYDLDRSTFKFTKNYGASIFSFNFINFNNNFEAITNDNYYANKECDDGVNCLEFLYLSNGYLYSGLIAEGKTFVIKKDLNSQVMESESYDKDGNLVGSSTCSTNCNFISSWTVVSGVNYQEHFKVEYVESSFNINIIDNSNAIQKDITYYIVNKNSKLTEQNQDEWLVQGVVGIYRKGQNYEFKRVFSNKTKNYDLFKRAYDIQSGENVLLKVDSVSVVVQ